MLLHQRAGGHLGHQRFLPARELLGRLPNLGYGASLWTPLLSPPRAVRFGSLDRVDARWFGRVDRVDVRYRVRDELLREPQTMHPDVVREPLRPEIRAVREVAVPVLLTAEAALGPAAMD